MTKRIAAALLAVLMICSIVSFSIFAGDVITGSFETVSLAFQSELSADMQITDMMRANARCSFSYEGREYILTYSGTDIILLSPTTYTVLMTIPDVLVFSGSSTTLGYAYVDTEHFGFPTLLYASGSCIYAYYLMGYDDFVGPLLYTTPTVLVDTSLSVSPSYFRVIDNSLTVRLISNGKCYDAYKNSGVYSCTLLGSLGSCSAYLGYCFVGDRVYYACYSYSYASSQYNRYVRLEYFDTLIGSSYSIASSQYVFNASGYKYCYVNTFSFPNLYYIDGIFYFTFPGYYVTNISTTTYTVSNGFFYAYDLANGTYEVSSRGTYLYRLIFTSGYFHDLRTGIYSLTSSSSSFTYNSYVLRYSFDGYSIPKFYTEADKLALNDKDGDGYDDASYQAGYNVGKDFSKNQASDTEEIGNFFTHMISAIMSAFLYLGFNISYKGTTILTVIFFIILGVIVYALIKFLKG